MPASWAPGPASHRFSSRCQPWNCESPRSRFRRSSQVNYFLIDARKLSYSCTVAYSSFLPDIRPGIYSKLAAGRVYCEQRQWPNSFQNLDTLQEVEDAEVVCDQAVSLCIEFRAIGSRHAVRSRASLISPHAERSSAAPRWHAPGPDRDPGGSPERWSLR